MQVSASGRAITLVYGEVKFIPIFAGDHPQRERKSEETPVASENLTNNRP